MSLFNKIWKSKLWLLITIVILIAVNWLASLYHTRIDFTNEKRFTLSTPTKKVLQKLDDVVQVDVFLKGNFPSGFKKLANSTNELLSEFKEIAGNKLQYRFISPDENVESTNIPWADSLNSMGISPLIVNAQIKSGEQQLKVFPIALASYKGSVYLINLYEGNNVNLTASEINSAEALLEYTFTKAIYQVTAKSKPMIAYSVGNGEAVGPESFDLRSELQYEDTLFMLNLNKVKFIPDTFNLLLVVKPILEFSDAELLKIDQYVMRGGKLLIFVDKLNAEMDSLKIKNEVIAYDRELGLDNLLFKYGTRIKPELLMDLQCDRLPFDINGDGQFKLLPWNYFPLFQSSANHVINKNLGFVNSRFVNSIDTSIEVEGILKTVLLQTSSKSRSIGTPALISGKENVLEPESEKYNRQGIPAAVLLEGKFTSLFKNRVSQSQLDSLNYFGYNYFSECLKPNKMIVVADGDIVLNSFYKDQPLPMGVNAYSMVNGRQTFPVANRAFLQNCVEFLINDNGLIEAKSKDYTLRFLDPEKVEAQKTTWQLINILAPVIMIILFALLYQFIRRRKYTVI